MLGVHVELIADVLVNFPIRKQRVCPIKCVGFGKYLRIFEGDLNIEMPEIRPRVAFDDVQILAVWNTLTVEPCLVVKSDRVDDKRVGFPFGNRVAHPQRLQILRMTTTVKEQLAIAMNIAFVENHNQRWRLDE